MTRSLFADLGVPAALVRALADRGISDPTPIQAATLPDSLAGRDVLGRGRTGSGKTFAFLLPLITRLRERPTAPLRRRPRALILAPTRELVAQIDDSFQILTANSPLTSRVVFGGVGQGPQVEAIRRGVDVVIACPGRLEDLIGQGEVSLDAVEITVLDEADHMADLGFLPGVKRILDRTPRDGQRMLFSATLDAGVDVLVKRYLSRPVTHEADSAEAPIDTMTHHVLRVRAEQHLDVLTDLVAAPGRTVVFARTKHRAKKFAKQLNAKGVPAVELHGNLSQGARTRTMEAFHSGRASTLVATDIAARGIHVDDVALVIHADPPAEHKAYVHRSGRTARAGSAGTVVTLMTPEQNADVRALMTKAGIRPTTTDVALGHPLLTTLAPGARNFPGAIALTEPQPTQARRNTQRGSTPPGRAVARQATGDGGRRSTGSANAVGSRSGGSQAARSGGSQAQRSGGSQAQRSGGSQTTRSGGSQAPRRGPSAATSARPGRRRSAADFSSGR